ncbi:MAG: hypothetical protein IPK19_23020 [Chloroflexi bacterium]|nr:hypothetical protein [Chloroflexota bacterium]
MRFWILLLRLTGLLLIGFGVVGQTYFYTISRLSANGLFIAFVGDVLAALALALLCFGGASGLVHLRRLELRNDQQRAALKVLVREWRGGAVGGAVPPPPYPAAQRDRFDLDSSSEIPQPPSDYRPPDPFPYEQQELDARIAQRRRTDIVAGLNPIYGSGVLYDPGSEVRQAPAASHLIIPPAPMTPAERYQAEQQASAAMRQQTRPNPSVERYLTERQAAEQLGREAYVRRMQAQHDKRRKRQLGK